ncbi:hypothetical protein D3C84_961350 [compost metagenome]
MHVADREVALIPQRVIGQVKLLEVVEDVLVAPVDDRQELEAAAGDGQHRQLATAARLLPAQAGEPGLGAELPQGPVHGLHLVELVVAGDPLDPLLPQQAEAGLLPGR